MAKHYDEFDLVFQSSGEHYTVQLLNSPLGQADGEFRLPFTQGELRDFYNRIGQRNRSTRRVDSPDLDAAKKFGGSLFRATFQGELLGRLRASADRSRASGRGLRVRLRLKGTPLLAEMPWEFLYDSEQDHFLAMSSRTPVVRYLELAQNIAPLKVRLPLKILVVIAGPGNLPRLDAEGEWERLQTSLGALVGDGVVVLERLPVATLDALRRRARGAPFHVLHFIGHGSFDSVLGDGALHFEDAKGMSDPVSGHLLGSLLRDHDSLRLAVLNACEGARQSAEDPFSGVAQSLCQQQMPAVIAMQFEISDDAAKRFSEEFYAAIADCSPVDAAVADSRKALFGGRFGQEWPTPVLYMRSPDGMLFDIQRKPKVPGKPAEAKPLRDAEEEQRGAEARRRVDAERAAVEAKASAEAAEVERLAEEGRRAADARRKAEVERDIAEAQRRAEKDREALEAWRRDEAVRKAGEVVRAAEAERVATRDEAARKAAEVVRAARAAAELAELRARAEAERVAALEKSKAKWFGSAVVAGTAVVGCFLGAVWKEMEKPPFTNGALVFGIFCALLSGLLARLLFRKIPHARWWAAACGFLFVIGYVSAAGETVPPGGQGGLLAILWTLAVTLGPLRAKGATPVPPPEVVHRPSPPPPRP